MDSTVLEREMNRNLVVSHQIEVIKRDIKKLEDSESLVLNNQELNELREKYHEILNELLEEALRIKTNKLATVGEKSNIKQEDPKNPFFTPGTEEKKLKEKFEIESEHYAIISQVIKQLMHLYIRLVLGKFNFIQSNSQSSLEVYIRKEVQSKTNGLHALEQTLAKIKNLPCTVEENFNEYIVIAMTDDEIEPYESIDAILYENLQSKLQTINSEGEIKVLNNKLQNLNESHEKEMKNLKHEFENKTRIHEEKIQYAASIIKMKHEKEGEIENKLHLQTQEILKLRQKIDQQETEMSSNNKSQPEVKKLITENKNLKRTIEELKVDLKNKKQETVINSQDKLKSEEKIFGLQEKLNKMSSNLKSRQDAERSAIASNKEKVEQINELKDANKKLNEKLKVVRVKLEALQQRELGMELIETDLYQLQGELENERENHSKLVELMSEVKNQLITYKTQLTESEAERQRLVHHHETQLTETMRTATEAKTRVDELELEKKKLNAQQAASKWWY